ncbi:hypothetical protein CBR_g38963 [Chara braunii]|uniref:acetylglutamate kinase n=1 Tax=Chara braunii TaxID=69332 RepID=A0A388K0T4_CHABU|nr:hypothetical protein CBR_g38963 [Chara braunii]|eukprot:GBG63652.1 hypothetical protein CBR_g38963 [Chara braunii]
MAVSTEAFVRAVQWSTSVAVNDRGLTVENCASHRVGEMGAVSRSSMRLSTDCAASDRWVMHGPNRDEVLALEHSWRQRGGWQCSARRREGQIMDWKTLTTMRGRTFKAVSVWGMEGEEEDEEQEDKGHRRENSKSSMNGRWRGSARMRSVATMASASAAAISTARTGEKETIGGEADTARAEAQTRVDVLAEALPYMQRFRGKTIVVKYGGAAMKDESLKADVIKDLVLLTCIGVRPVLVHGGGPEINQWLKKLGIQSEFRNGLRVTDEATMEVVEMVLVGKVNKSIVSLINKAGGSGVGMCGKDAGLITARALDTGLGFVGEVASMDTTVLTELVEGGRIPVVATVAADLSGQAYNINADAVAGALAASLKAEKLILMTDVPGVMRDGKDIASLITEVDVEGARNLMAEGVVSGGMIPKVECCIRALSNGVKKAHIIDGRAPHSLLMELLTDQGAGTMISP